MTHAVSDIGKKSVNYLVLIWQNRQKGKEKLLRNIYSQLGIDSYLNISGTNF